MSQPLRAGLTRQLGLWSAIAVVIGTTIGSGIFRTPASVANRLPGPLPLFGVWVAGGLLALCGALTLAEVAGAHPNTGGIFDFIRRAWGRLAAFLFGWAELAIIRAASLGAISTTFAEYFMRVLGYDPALDPYAEYVHYIAAAAIAVTAAFNYVGLRSGSLVQNLTTIAKYFGLLFIVVLALGYGFSHDGASHFTPAAPAGSFTTAAFGLALVSVLWAYDGWADLTFISGEIKDPRRNIPRALLMGTGLVIGIYLLANVAYVAMFPIETIRGSKLVAADVAAKLLGAGGVTFIAITVMLSTFGTLNGSILTSPRIFYAMADEQMLFRQFRDVHPRFQTPHLAILLTAALGVVFVMLRTFEQLADTFVTAIIPFYALGVASIFVLRKRAGYAPPFRAPLYPLTPILFCSAIVYLLVNQLMDPEARMPTLAVFGVILAGIPLYYLTVSKNPGPGADTEPEPEPEQGASQPLQR
jgi:APA family basic amino acid/polyamine antiporter